MDMKPKIMNIIKYDYLAKLLFLIATVVTLLLVLILMVGETSVLGMVIPVIIIAIALLVARTMMLNNELIRIGSNRVIGSVLGTRKNNGNFYISFTYQVNDKEFKGKAMLLIGPIQKIKLAKLTEVNLIVDKDNPKKVYIADLFY